MALTTSEQMTLHSYYATTSSKTDADLVERRDKLMRVLPSMASVAGKAYAKFDKAQLQIFHCSNRSDDRPHGAVTKGRAKSRIVVCGLVRPDSDHVRVARAITAETTRNR
jgi:hypothetical protein